MVTPRRPSEIDLPSFTLVGATTEIGYPSIFSAALSLLGVEAVEAVMVGDSFRHDIEGALGVGMRAILLNRGDAAAPTVVGARDVPVIRFLRDLTELL